MSDNKAQEREPNRDKELAYDRLQLSAERGVALSQYMMGEVARSGTLFPPERDPCP